MSPRLPCRLLRSIGVLPTTTSQGCCCCCRKHFRSRMRIAKHALHSGISITSLNTKLRRSERNHILVRMFTVPCCTIMLWYHYVQRNMYLDIGGEKNVYRYIWDHMFTNVVPSWLQLGENACVALVSEILYSNNTDSQRGGRLSRSRRNQLPLSSRVSAGVKMEGSTIQLALVLLSAILVRWCISLNPYSGAGKPPMFGDYEAQRHWMEITYNLPIKDWYQNTTKNDLQYWGLDYPPLTAYHSYLCGMVANFINPDWVTLGESHGFESYGHKLFMRYSVLVADLLIFLPAVIAYFGSQKLSSSKVSLAVLCTFLYPGLSLIDYGHFQFNGASLGLMLWAVTFLSKGRDLWGAIFFSLSLNYKQMELYHAMPFFAYLFGSCLRNKHEIRILKLIKLGIVVLGTFGVCWSPFLSNKETALQVLHRLFPFSRGLYEDKVANVWCSLSILVKLKQLLSHDKLIKLCLSSTLVGLIPSTLDLLIRPSLQKFKISLINSSLIFFLLSFQVHEKSILLAALPVCLMLPERPLTSVWFLLISVFSMFPLLVKDGLITAYSGSMPLFTAVIFLCFKPFENETFRRNKSIEWMAFACFGLSIGGAGALNVASLTMQAPKSLPDLFPVLISVYSCGHFVLFTLYFHYIQFTSNESMAEDISRTKATSKLAVKKRK